MSWSCPFHSFQLPLRVPVIFLVRPLHSPCMSRSFVASHCPTSPVVPIGFLVPFHSPCIPLVFISVPFMSLSGHFCFPFISPCFPVSTSYFLPSLALACISPLLPPKKHSFPSVFAKRTSKNTEFSRFSAKGDREPKPAKSWQGDSSLGPQNPTYPTLGGGGYPLSSLRYPTRLRNVGGYFRAPFPTTEGICGRVPEDHFPLAGAACQAMAGGWEPLVFRPFAKLNMFYFALALIGALSLDRCSLIFARGFGFYPHPPKPFWGALTLHPLRMNCLELRLRRMRRADGYSSCLFFL